MNVLIGFFGLQTLSVILTLIRVISLQIMISVLRFSYGAFLLFSGGVKIIDPLGFSYKLQEYFEVFGMEWLVPMSLFLSVFVIVFEILLGVCLIFGVQVRKVMWGNLLLMLFFTFLTFFSAYFNKVTDCGCFGDFMKLEPWHSFMKDIHLLFVSIILFIYQKKIKSLFKETTSNQIYLFFIATMVPVIFAVYTLSHLPVIDFRAYHIGANLIEDRKTCDQIDKPCLQEEIWYKVVDKQLGDTLRMLSHEWASKWREYDKVPGYDERVIIDKGYEPPIKDFDIIHPLTGTDFTDSFLQEFDRLLLVISYDIEKTNVEGYRKLENSITLGNTSYSTSVGDIPVIGLSSSSKVEIEEKLSKVLLAPFPYFLVDQTTLKTIIRSNPGVVLLENGVVVNKWHWRDFPTFDDIIQDPSLHPDYVK